MAALIAVMAVFAAGVGTGYGIRSYISYRRHWVSFYKDGHSRRTGSHIAK